MRYAELSVNKWYYEDNYNSQSSSILRSRKDESALLLLKVGAAEQLIPVGQICGRAGEELWAGSCAKKVDENFPLYSEARGSKSKEICIIRKLIFLSLNFPNKGLTLFSRATKEGSRKVGGRESYSWSHSTFRTAQPFVELLRLGLNLCVVFIGKKELSFGLLFVLGRKIPPLDPHENGNNGAMKLGKQTTQTSRRCCWPGGMAHCTWRSQSPSPCSAEGPPNLSGLVPHLERSEHTGLASWKTHREQGRKSPWKRIWENSGKIHHIAFCAWSAHGREWMLGNNYSWVFVKNLSIFSICTKILLAYYVCEIIKCCSTLISCVP